MEYDKYFQDHFGFREQLIQLDIKNPLKITSSPIINDGIKGKNGWYFYSSISDGNNMIDFYKRNLFDSIQIEQFSKHISDTTDWCKENGIKFIFLIAPNKHSVYEEFFPGNRPEGITRADQITDIFDKLGVPYIFPRDFLISKKADYDFPLYYETDTHWNSLGAYLTSTLLYKEFSSFFPNITFPKIKYDIEIYYSMTSGDILPMLGIENAKSTHPEFKPVGFKNTDFYTYVKNDGRKLITNGSNKEYPRALVFCDSFMELLEPFISPFFSEAEYIHHQFSESDKELILEFKPDIIIFESIERSAQSIVNQ